ncbi:immunoglobulin domain protein [Opisthorchis viverrini]|uniref:Immunoglobulin domain protein n=1 Tax=Opisthorchis viverrini TaxID=6198 RepID=A0A1S8X8K8_OPIVI|nr:immunoglobulin domain protein [Opisthorchis viverrini]
MLPCNSVQLYSPPYCLSLPDAPVIDPFEKAVKRVLELAAIQQSCQAFGKPPASVKWIDKQGLVVSNSSDLRLPGITRNGVKHFICTASNYIGETRRELTFGVLYPPQVFIPSSVMANEGERLEITCRADSNPPVRRIYWTVNSSASLGQSDSSARYNSRTLVIPNVSQRNFGEYTCHAESVENLAEILDEQEMKSLSKDHARWWLTGYRRSATLTLFVHYHPGQTTLLVSPSDKVNEEETVMFRCLENSTSPGYPRPTIYWFKLNLARIPHSLFHSVDWWSVPIQPIQTNSTTYVVHRAQMFDSGIYGCYPKNSMGEGRPSHTFLTVTGKPLIISSSPEVNFVEITDLKSFAPDGSYHPKTGLAGPTYPRSASSVSLNCTLLGSSDMIVTWYYSPSDTKGALGNEYKINMDDYNSALRRSPTENYISQNSSKVTNLDITYVASTLAIPFLHSYDVPTSLLRNWMQYPSLKCDPKSMPDYIDWTGEPSFHIWRHLNQLRQADGFYRCEASSRLGNTSHTMRIRVQTVPVPLPSPEELIAYDTNPSDFKSRSTFIGPLICQFAARPPLTELTWWREQGSVLGLVHKTTLPEEEPKIHETREAFILTGRPALSQFLISKALEQKRAPLHQNQIYPSETTLFSAMWIKTSGSITATNYTCVASNALGNSSQKIQIVPQSHPIKVSKLWVLHTTSTSVILTWSPGFHGTVLDLFSAVNFWDLIKEHQHGKTLRPFLQNLLQEWEIAKRCAQTFKLELVDHGRQKQGEMLGRSSSNSAKQSDDFGRNTGILHALSSGHSTVVNITEENPKILTAIAPFFSFSFIASEKGLLPSHVYSARIIAEHGNSRSLPSDRIIFITDAYKPTKPAGIVFDSAQRALRIPKEDPAACVKVQVSGDGGRTWQNVIPWKHQLRMLRVNGIDASPYHIGSSCAPLSWSGVTEVNFLMAGVYRVQYCDIANPEECSEPVNPKQDLPVYLLITVGCLCILVVAVLIGLFGYFICIRPGRRSKASCSFAMHRQPCSNEASSLIHGIPDTDVQCNDTAWTRSVRGTIPTEIVQWDQPLDAVADVTNRSIWNNSN